MAKQIRQFNLPHSDQYFITGYSYLSLEDGGGSICENCGKPIARIVTVKNQHGQSYLIGADCAETLSSLDKWELKKANTGIKEITNFYKKWNELKKYEGDKSHSFPAIILDGKNATLFSCIQKNYHGRPFYSLKMERNISTEKLHPDFIAKNTYQPDDFKQEYPQHKDDFWFGFTNSFKQVTP